MNLRQQTFINNQGVQRSAALNLRQEKQQLFATFVSVVAKIAASGAFCLAKIPRRDMRASVPGQSWCQF